MIDIIQPQALLLKAIMDVSEKELTENKETHSKNNAKSKDSIYD